MKKLLILFGSLFILGGSGVSAQEDLDAQYAKDLLKPGTTVPAIMIEKDDKQVDWLSKGKYTILEFWASWCGDCRRDMSKMRSINRTFVSDSIKIKGYSFDTKPESWEKCRRDSVLMWDHQLSPITMRDSEAAKNYHLNWIPAYYLLDKENKVILATVMIEKLQAKLREIAPNAPEDDLPLSSLQTIRQSLLKKIITQIYQNTNYPNECQKFGAEAKTLISFVIDEEGELYDLTAQSVSVTNVQSEKYKSLVASEQKKMDESFAKLFAQSAMKSLRDVDKNVWKEADSGRGRIKLTLPVTFKL